MADVISAGAIIFRVDRTTGQKLFLLLHYPEGHWEFVKGHVEEGETKEMTTKRECEEETGIKADLSEQLFLIRLQENLWQKTCYLWKKFAVINYTDWLALPPGTPEWRILLHRYPRLLKRAWQWLTHSRK